ncbi:flagellin [Burkholderia pseudomallei]|uniref:flagellin n=1 Tax=Burkholderia pseudomallei TaxID=28450 RepID=UPI00071809CC|nr:flagellin [Burkholderia pseudomallei]MBF3450420.1 flagellin [Burkholderia pseudomallei]MBF3807653.1 flagellin [Burkholderia pseudomallei]MBF3839427.1 flagellin [Burkholderia pseudomallei]OMS61459.1 flagellin [Burkholderia pseudomallei]OMS67150.1 flagellin [Burkholderia pseudomallei]
MLGINSNINSLVAQQNLNGSQGALSQAITRLSSGKRINSAADDAAGLAIATRMQTQINGLNQGVSNANDGVSILQTASSGLTSLTNSLQRIRQLAVQASNGPLSASDASALQQEVAQQISEVNRIASQTNYNGKNILDGSAGTLSFQVGANVGQTVSVDLTQSMSAAKIGGGMVQTGQTLGTIKVAIDSSGAAWSSGSTGQETTQINVVSDGKGGFTFTDQNNQALSSTAVTAVFGSATAGTGTAASPAFQTLALSASATSALTATDQANATAMVAQINAVNKPQTVSNLDISTQTGAYQAMVSIDNALATVNNLQATLGAAQNRFTAIATTQQAGSNNLAQAQSQIQSADFAQETANLSRAQVLQQAGISVLAQANSLPQQVLKLLQ